MGVWGLERRLLKARFSWLGLLNWGGGGGVWVYCRSLYKKNRVLGPIIRFL